MSLETTVAQMRTTYINGNPEKEVNNIFKKLMFEKTELARERTALPKNSHQLLTVLLLDHIKANCEVFNNNFKKLESS